MDYKKVILNKLINIYERREVYNKDITEVRAISFDIAKEFKEYTDRYNHYSYKNINTAIEFLENNGYITFVESDIGQYKKVNLVITKVEDVYKYLEKESIPNKSKKQLYILQKYEHISYDIIKNIISEFKKLVLKNKKIPYDIKYDSKRLNEILNVLVAIVNIKQETYIRNFSTALFKDSKMFQKEYKSVIESILFDFTDEILEKEKILEYYNLYENPTYVLIKGDIKIEFENSIIYVKEIKNGIALSNNSLNDIKNINIFSDAVITVENLTTYHDSDENNSVYIYLGGFHNNSKEKLLRNIYKYNPNCNYYHKGDIDVYGFLILDNLVKKTGIPFLPLEMDIKTIDRFYNSGMYKELSEKDKKMIIEKKCNQLIKYSDVLDYMLEHNCKVEQESIKAVELIEK